jgi:hypothetical protein
VLICRSSPLCCTHARLMLTYRVNDIYAAPFR